MTEIPMTRDTTPAKPRTDGGSRRNIIIAVVIIFIIGGSAVGFSLLNTNTEPAWESRQLWQTTGLDPVVYPYYYADDFQLNTEHIEGTLAPEVLFTITIDPGTDTETIMTSITVHDVDVATFDSLEWSGEGGRNDHQVDWGYEEGSYSAILDLPQTTGTYTWCFYLYLPTGEKSSTWSVDIEIRLKHYPVF